MAVAAKRLAGAALWPLLLAAAQQPPARDAAAAEKPAPASAAASSQRRVELNLLGITDAAAGESRRNENVQFNLIDNNALKELNVRLGTTATIVEEFAPERGHFGAEFGNAPAEVLHLAAPAGSGLHGSLWGAHLNSVFSARSFFQAGDVKPARTNDYGFTFAGPLWRGGALALEGAQQKARGSVNGNVLVPRSDERTPLAADPAVRALVARFLAAYPRELPNRTDVNERALNTNAPQTINHDSAAIRLDQSRGARDRLSLRYAFTGQHVEAFQLVAGQNPNTDTRSHIAQLTWNRQWSAATLTDFSAGFDRVGSLLVPEKNAVGPLVMIAGLEPLGPGGVIPINRALNLFRYAGAIRRAAGHHSWSVGFGLVRRQLNGTESDVHRGFFSFNHDFGRDSITNLRLGAPTQHLISIGHIHRGFRNWDAQVYAGDRWRAAPNLTLNAALRYQPVTTPVEVNGLNVIPYPCDCNNLAPQFGFAWRLPRRWGVVRGAYGLQYGEIFPVTFQQVRFSPPGNYKIMIPAPSLLDPLGVLAGTGRRPDAIPTLYMLDPRLATPYSHQYNFSWQTRAGTNWNLELGYLGSRSHKLLTMWYLNRAHPVPGVSQTSATVNLRRADPRYAEIRRVINGSRGYLDAGRVSLVVRRWRGLSLDASYWFSKALDLGSSYTNTAYDRDSRESRSQSEFDTHRDMKGPSSFDQAHAALWRAAYAVPAPPAGRLRALLGNWEVSAVALLKTGTPFTVVAGSDAAGYGNVDANGGDRPNLLDASILSRTIGHPDTSRRLLPRSAFTFIQPTDVRGNLGRNTFRKGAIRNVNAALSRTWVIQADKRLTLRVESVNLFNTAQFAEPGLEMASPDFGQITNTLNDGRTLRFLVQFAF
ncbi:MAG: TonB-dependent receptor [Acidobacteriota bacterium]